MLALVNHWSTELPEAVMNNTVLQTVMMWLLRQVFASGPFTATAIT